MVRWGVGYDLIDVDAATAEASRCEHADLLHSGRAEHAISLLLAIARRIVWAHDEFAVVPTFIRDGPPLSIDRQKRWVSSVVEDRLRGGEKAQGWECESIAYDKYRPAEELETLNTPLHFEQVWKKRIFDAARSPDTRDARIDRCAAYRADEAKRHDRKPRVATG